RGDDRLHGDAALAGGPRTCGGGDGAAPSRCLARRASDRSAGDRPRRLALAAPVRAGLQRRERHRPARRRHRRLALSRRHDRAMAAASKSQAGALGHYRQKRDFSITSEPAETAATPARNGEKRAFVVQKHWASRLHYDFRLELDGVLVSWAVPKGPAFDPSKMQMAIHVEDHPLAYAAFEGTIPPRQYGAGRVIVWDRGSWTPVGDAQAGLAAGKLVFRLHGEKLAGLWE